MCTPYTSQRGSTTTSPTPNDDQCFLLYFIMSNYFGPDIKTETSKKSVSQRISEGLPSYTLEQLTGSFFKRVEMEHLYYYILRNAHKSLTLKLSFLRRYFQGFDSPSVENCNYPQFTDLFPPELHPQSRFKSRHMVIDNVVFIENPETLCLKAEDVERFKRLTGVKDLCVDRNGARLHSRFDGSGVLCNMALPVTQSCNGGGSRKVKESDDFSETEDELPHADLVKPIRSVSYNDGMASHEDDDGGSEKVDGPAVLFLPSRPTMKELSHIVAASKNGFALTGSAALGRVGPILGLVDIGESEDAYLFRMSLPGVKRDEKEFSCEVDTDGKVLISGVTTTGETMVSRYSQVFEMQTHNLCPPGHFSVTFQLPGPVDPHQFSGNFGTDGILEGIVMKGKRR